MNAPPTLRYDSNSHTLFLLDQTRLPGEVIELRCESVQDVFDAIRRLSVRGAPAIGCAAAYGVCVGVARGQGVREVCDLLAESRPTAVNLFWALDRMRRLAGDLDALVAEATAIETEDREMCAAIGRHGAGLLPAGGVLTHCNTGGLATAGDGTALSVILEAHRRRGDIHVYADETRPLLQGARLTTWECRQRGVPVTLLCDGAAGWAMASGKIQSVVTGTDRVAANGDAANKIGTYSVARLAKAHGIPFYIAGPSSTFDLSLASGADIPIEERGRDEVARLAGVKTAPDGVDVWNPAFDVTPAELITGLITERGVIEPNTEAIAEKVGRPT